MAKPRKNPTNVIPFQKEKERRLTRAEDFAEKPHYFYRDTPPNGAFLIVEYQDYDRVSNRPLYTTCWYENGKPVFYYGLLDKEYAAGTLKLMSWRLASDWHGSTVRALNHGEIVDLFKPTKAQKKARGKPYQLRNVKTAVVFWKYVIFGRGLSKGVKSIKAANGKLSKSVNFSVAQIRKIESEVKRTLGSVSFAELKKHAIYCGQYEGASVYPDSEVEAIVTRYKKLHELSPAPLEKLGAQMRSAGMKSATKRA